MAFEGCSESDRPGFVILGGHFASLAGCLAAATVAARVRRLSYAWLGWPGRFMKMRMVEEAANEVARNFEAD